MTKARLSRPLPMILGRRGRVARRRTPMLRLAGVTGKVHLKPADTHAEPWMEALP